MQKIQTFLWLNDQAVEASKLYLSAFNNSKIISTMPGPGGNPMGVTVELDGREFILFNGGPMFRPTHSISFTAFCGSESEIEEVWNKLSDGGKVMMELNKYPWAEKYGWVEDKFGVSWQLTFTDRKQPITPSLLFSGAQQGRAEEAVNLYTSKFKNSNINIIARYEEGEPGPKGQIKFSSFSLDGQGFIAMDSGRPMDVPFTPGISFFINCETQDQVDYYWESLGDGGRFDRCGWLQDKFGVSWQVIPTALGKALSNSDPMKAGRAMQAMLKMDKIIIADIEAAVEGIEELAAA
jgi:predicted 3-demethylubiquinone-9 3-methyltransferase (glyoxalase superfamily)